MSEKKSNGQVPEEGPDGKNLEQSEKKESFAFLEETIKPKKISRQQGMKQLIRIAICGLVLGGSACLGFFALRPLAQHLFPEKTQVVTIQEDNQSEEDLAEGGDTTEQNDAQNQQEISYVQMMSKAYEKALTAKKSVVSVTKGAEQENWNAEATGIDESVSGVIVADNGPEILILSYASICEDAKEWCVTFSDKSEYKASLKKKDKNSGFAIFAVDKKSLSQLNIKKKNNAISINNETANWITVTTIKAQNVKVNNESILLPPFSNNDITLKNNNASEYELTVVDDYGNNIHSKIAAR